MFYIGIDIAKNAHEVCLLDANGDVLDGNTFKVPNTLGGFERFQKKLDKFGITPDNALLGMEATGHYWIVFYSWLFDKGFEIKVINPLVTDGYRKMNIRKSKTDRIDAEVIAKVLIFGEFQETSLPSEDTISLKQLCRYRLWLVQSCSDLKRKIVALLDQVFPEYAALFTDVFGMTSKELLRSFTTPEEMVSVHTRTLTTLLAKASKGHFGKAKALEIKAVASRSVGIRFGVEAFAFQIRQMIEQIAFTEEQISELDEQITNYMQKLNSPIETIPGIGPVYGATILAEIGDVNRFPSGKQIVSYAGIDASVHASGEFQGTESHMSKRGSAYLRRAIYGAAFVASHSDPELTAYYQRLRARGKHHSVAVGAVARKLCYLIYAVLSENRPYEQRS